MNLGDSSSPIGHSRIYAVVMVPIPWTREPDSELVDRVLRCEPDAFEVLISRYQRKACAIALGIGVRPDALRDVLQEAFLRSFEALPKLRSRDAFGPWFLSIVRNAARRGQQETARATRHPDLDVVASGYPETPERDDFNAYLWRQVEKLPAGIRETIYLYYYEGESVRAVAGTLGIARSAVKKRLQRGRELLRDRLWRQLEECIRDMLPSTRDWKRGARRMTLLLMAGASASWGNSARAASGSVTAAGASSLGGIAGRLVLMSGKHFIGAAAVSLLIAAGGIFLLRGTDNSNPDDGGGEGYVAAMDASSPAPGTQGDGDFETTKDRREDCATGHTKARVPSPVDMSSMDRELDLFGIVLDRARTPVPGAVVETYFYPWQQAVVPEEYYRQSRPGPQTLSGSDGSFALRLERGQVVNLRVSASGHAPTWLPGSLAGEQVEVVLSPSGALEVIVADGQGNPVSGAELKLTRIEPWVSVWVVGQGVSDAEGRYLFPDLEPGELRLRVEHAQFGSPPSEWVRVVGSATTTRAIALPTGEKVRGRVTDVTTGQPVAGALVCRQGDLAKSVRTDESGHYEYSGWTRPSSETLTASARGYAIQGLFVGETNVVDFELAPGLSVVGQVVDRDGAGVPGALVSMRSSSGGFDEPYVKHSASILTEDDGFFTLQDLRPDLRHTLTVVSAAHGWLRFPVKPLAAGSPALDVGVIELRGGSSIEGVALSPEGTRIRGAIVGIRRMPRDGFDEHRRTDDLGRFRFPNLCPGEFELVLMATNWPEVSSGVRLPEGTDLRDITLSLPDGEHVQVRVAEEGGPPLEGLTVHVGSVSGRTDSKGLATLRGLPGTRVAIRVVVGADSGYLFPSNFSVVPSGQIVDITLPRSASIRGIVRSEDGAPLCCMNVKGRPRALDSRAFSASTDNNGEFDLQVPEGTRMDIHVEGPVPFLHRMHQVRTGAKVVEPLQYRGESSGVMAPASQIQILAKESEGQ